MTEHAAATAAELHRLRYVTTGQIRAYGEYVAYCPDCDCRKSGDAEEPNGVDEGCSREACRCHEDDE